MNFKLEEEADLIGYLPPSSFSHTDQVCEIYCKGENVRYGGSRHTIWCMRAIGDGPRHFEQWSSDEEDI
ncbi:hypothetical protein TNCV_2531871 [Trichonephila clavipes]|nr:hypothetical protein TNCV_2531871 [Trichonephila clavipes]